MGAPPKQADNLNIMDIQNIRAFLMVVETRSFSRAAEKLFITQPAISKRISTLELSLDCKLFDRLGKNIQLTQAGEAIIPSYQRIIAEINETQRIISTLRAQVSGQLKFGTSHHIGLHRLHRCYANTPASTRMSNWTYSSWIQNRPLH